MTAYSKDAWSLEQLIEALGVATASYFRAEKHLPIPQPSSRVSAFLRYVEELDDIRYGCDPAVNKMDIAQELIAMLFTPKRRAHAIEALREHGQPHKTDPARVTDGVALTLGRMKRWAQEDVLPRLDAGRTHAAPWAHEIAAHKVLPSDATSAVVLVTPEMRRVVLLVSDFVEAGRATAAQREGVGWFLGGETGGDEKGRHREALRRAVREGPDR